tara:strand:+ start:169 stop:414 length:246 start_codon:yes stop_codon:yes gene_type:complete
MTPSTGITDAIATMARVDEDLSDISSCDSGTPEHVDLITNATLLYTLITEMYGPEYFTTDEITFISHFANHLNIHIEEIYS